MIVCRVWGGLGNQLFQYAYSYTVSKITNQVMYLDVSFFNNQNMRSFKLGKLMITNNKCIDNSELPKIVKLFRSKLLNKIIRISRGFSFKLSSKWIYFKETRFKYRKLEYSIKNENIYLDGYWQCEEYFSEYADEIRAQFVLKNTLSKQALKIKQEICSVNSIAVHIRRGDYTNFKTKLNKNLYKLDQEYYSIAIKKISGIVKDPVFYFFSDDIEWVKNEYGNSNNYYYVNIKNIDADLEEIMLMSSCKHNIIANSTFSWWGAWLNSNKEKLVIAPSEYFGNQDIIPENWLTIPVKRRK